MKYREKLEANLSNNNCKATWEIMKAMAGMNKKKNDLSIDEDICGYAKKLNAFYARFNNHDFREETRKEVEKIMKGSGSHNEYVVSENDVACECKEMWWSRWFERLDI